MDEEIKNEVIEEVTPVELTPTEQRATAQGWVPQDEWTGDPDLWRPAKEFLDRGELFKKIDDQNRTIKDFKKVVDDLRKHNSRIAEVEFKRALDSLKRQKRDAYAEGDADAVIEIEEKIDAVKEAQREAVTAPQDAAPEVQNPVFTNWVERNQWYQTNRAMKAFADDVGREAAGRGMSPSEVLSLVENEVKKEFAEKFSNQRRNVPGNVEDSSPKSTSTKKDNFTLSEEERRVMRRIVATGALTEADYIAQLKKIKEV